MQTKGLVMVLGTQLARGRCAAVWAGVSSVAASLVGGLVPVLVEAGRVAGRGQLGNAAFDSVLVWGCALVAAAVTVWMWLVATLVVVDAARGLPAARRGVPVAVRRAVLVLCGAALTSGLAAPAMAEGTTSPGPASPEQVLAGLRLPERVAVSPAAGGDRPPPDPAAASSEPAAEPVAPSAATVLVAPGDTLWGLAADRLGPDASDQQTAAAWPELYALNRDLIGPDPGLIEPGQRLVLPPSGQDGGRR